MNANEELYYLLPDNHKIISTSYADVTDGEDDHTYPGISHVWDNFNPETDL